MQTLTQHDNTKLMRGDFGTGSAFFLHVMHRRSGVAKQGTKAHLLQSHAASGPPCYPPLLLYALRLLPYHSRHQQSPPSLCGRREQRQQQHPHCYHLHHLAINGKVCVCVVCVSAGVLGRVNGQVCMCMCVRESVCVRAGMCV